MYKIIRGRSTGKAHELLEAANKVQGTVLTENKEGLRVKANAYGFYSINVIDYNDLKNGNYYLGEPLFIHNGDKFLKYIIEQNYGLVLQGFTATDEEQEGSGNG